MIKPAWFLILAVLVAVAWIAWRYAPGEFKGRAIVHMRRNWWIPLAVVVALFATVAILSLFSIKTF